jgi:hypothetical protein
VSNADIAPTLAHVLGLQLPATGRLQGRVLSEALSGGPDAAAFHHGTVSSRPTPSGRATVLECQEYQGRKYFDTASFSTVSGAAAPSGGSTVPCK